MHSITLENVTFFHGQQRILQDINLQVEAGEFICLLGPSGCGKSTLLRMLAGLDFPTRGTILLGDKPITGPGLDRGVVFQDYSLFPWLTTGQNIIFALKQAFPGKSSSFYNELAHKHLQAVKLGHAFDKLPSELSGGMRQRAAIARAFSMNPPVLLMDEPFGALDAVTRAHLQDALVTLWQQEAQGSKTIFFVTHDVDEALLLGTTVVVMGANPGRIRGIFPVELPRPRKHSQLTMNASSLQLRQTLLSLLYEETPIEETPSTV